MISDRKAYALIKENPAYVTQLQSDLNREKNKSREYHERFRDFVTGIKEFFSNNIPLDSELRAPEKLGNLASFWELYVCTKRESEPEPIQDVNAAEHQAEPKQEPAAAIKESLPTVRIPKEKRKKCRIVMQNVEENAKGRSY